MLYIMANIMVCAPVLYDPGVRNGHRFSASTSSMDTWAILTWKYVAKIEETYMKKN